MYTVINNLNEGLRMAFWTVSVSDPERFTDKLNEYLIK